MVMLLPAVGTAQKAVSTPDPAAAEVLAFERDVEAAIVRGDVAFMERACAPTFVFSHGDGWTTGGDPFRVDDRAQWLAVVKAAPYASRELDHVRVEMHGDVAITYGRYVARMKAGDPERQQFDLWFERVYARRGGRWQYLSHRTVDGPHFSRVK
jgi:ketosteroid isomerase-like protein